MGVEYFLIFDKKCDLGLSFWEWSGYIFLKEFRWYIIKGLGLSFDIGCQKLKSSANKK